MKNMADIFEDQDTHLGQNNTLIDFPSVY